MGNRAVVLFALQQLKCKDLMQQRSVVLVDAKLWSASGVELVMSSLLGTALNIKFLSLTSQSPKRPVAFAF